MKRYEELQSLEGQAAYQYYCMWFKSMNRTSPSVETFGTSKFFRTFINFVLFVQKVELPAVDKFIWLMVAKQYQPTIWMNNEVYAIYLEFLDQEVSGLEQALLSISNLLKTCDSMEIDPSEFFNKVTIQQVIRLLQLRRLSPWLLLFCQTFKHQLTTKATNEQKIVLENLIRPEYWPEALANNPDTVAQIRKLVKELQL